MNLENEILKLKQRVALLENVNSITREPVNPKTGSLWLDLVTTQKLKYWNGEQWIDV